MGKHTGVYQIKEQMRDCEQTNSAIPWPHQHFNKVARKLLTIMSAAPKT
jgi:hypothetical protein